MQQQCRKKENKKFQCVRVTKNAYFSLLVRIKQLLLVKFYDVTAEIRSGTGQDGCPYQKDKNVEIVM